MVVVQYPHCVEEIELEDGSFGLFECPYCGGEFEYEFEEIKLKNTVDDFKKKLRKVDNSLPKKYQLLDDMACSIQF